MLLSLSGINKSYGDSCILSDISFSVDEKEKLAVIGVNGAGKSTLFKIITGEISPDSGSVYIKKGAKTGYLPQNAGIKSDKTVYDEMLCVFSDIIDAETELNLLEARLPFLDKDELPKYYERYTALQEKLNENDARSYKSRIAGVLKGMGFSAEDVKKSVAALSGGEKTRVFLSKLLLSAPDLLLLDEPTNHLDSDSLKWLEDYIASYRGAAIIITHDRYFMERVTTKTFEIENSRGRLYNGSYSVYAAQKEELLAAEYKRYVNQQREIRRQEEVIKKLRSFNREKSIKRAESREKALSRIEPVSAPEKATDVMRMSLSPKIISGVDVLLAKEIKKGFDGNTLFSDIRIDIKRGERVGLLGRNGIGKSTLFKILMGILEPDSGSVKYGVNVNKAYYDQEQRFTNDKKTLMEEMSDTFPYMKSGEIRNMLAAFAFTGDDVFKTIGALSGGEKGRLALAEIMAGKANLIFLDEPTNHLDIASREVLENALCAYEGTIFFISHDRYFTNQVATRILELSKDGLAEYKGGYSFYMSRRTESENGGASDEKPLSESKGKWQKSKEEQAAKRKRQNALANTEKEIEAAENRISEIDALSMSESTACNHERLAELYKEKTELETKLSRLYELWEELSIENE